MYKPDNWIIIELPDKKGHKVLGGWSGGYLHGDAWRLNSGIVFIDADSDEDYYFIYGYSGSCYQCRKDCEIVRMNISGALQHLTDLKCKQVPISSILRMYENETIH